MGPCVHISARARLGAAVAAIVALSLVPGAAQTAQQTARVAFHDIPGVTEGLLTVELGNVIRKRCPEISARFFAGVSFMFDLKGLAVAAGYSDAEIRAFVEDRAEEARIKALADTWLAARGAARTDGASLCAVGNAEIDAGTQLGRLLQRNGS